MPVCWLFATLTSNPPLYRSPFGLPPAYLLPPHRFNVQPATLCRSLLDFLVPSLHFNVQSVPPAAPFWTSSCLFTASPPLQRPTCHSMPLPFGLPRAFPPLQRPIRPPCRTLLDFLLPIYCLPTASTSNLPLYAAPLWTSSCLPTASTSNPPYYRSPFWTSSCLFTAFPPLQRPIRHTLALLLDFILPSHHSNVQFATLHLGVRTSSQKTLDFQTQIYT